MQYCDRWKRDELHRLCTRTSSIRSSSWALRTSVLRYGRENPLCPVPLCLVVRLYITLRGLSPHPHSPPFSLIPQGRVLVLSLVSSFLLSGYSAGRSIMQLALSFSTLLASVLFVLSATGNGVEAAPAKRAPRSVTLPLTRIHHTRTDIHPQIVSSGIAMCSTRIVTIHCTDGRMNSSSSSTSTVA